MKLFKSKTSHAGSNKTQDPTALQEAAPHPDQLKCQVKAPNGSQVAFVPICLPLSIMASYAVKAAGGSDEAACIASVAVISQGNSIVSGLQPNHHLTETDAWEYVDIVARGTRQTLMHTVCNSELADRVEEMVRGGGQLILNSKKGECSSIHDSRDDAEFDDSVDDDVRSIATSVLDNFDRDSITYPSYRYETRSGNHTRHESGSEKLTYTTSRSRSYVSTADTERLACGMMACSAPNDYTSQMTESTRPTKSSFQRPHHLSVSFDPTWDTSHNPDFSTASKFDLDTFYPVSKTYYQQVPHHQLQNENLSVEPISDRALTVIPEADTEESDAHVPKVVFKEPCIFVPKAVSKTPASPGGGRGNFVVASPSYGSHESMMPSPARGIFATAMVYNGVQADPNTSTTVNAVSAVPKDVPGANNGQKAKSVSTNSVQSEMNKTGWCFGAHCSATPESPRIQRQPQIKKQSPIMTQPHYENNKDQSSVNTPVTYQSYVEAGKEVDEITFLNLQKQVGVKKKKSFFRKLKGLFRKK